MKKLAYLLPLGMILSAQLFRLMHWPGGSFLFLFGFLAQLIFSIILIFKLKDAYWTEKAMPFALTLLYISFMFKMLFWPGQIPVLIAGLVFGGIVLGIHFSKKKSLGISGGILALFLVFNVSMYFVRSHQILSAFAYFEPREIKDQNIYYWTTYSWLLYIVDETEEAVKANEKARTIVCSSTSDTISLNQMELDKEEFCEKLKQRESQIREGTWGAGEN